MTVSELENLSAKAIAHNIIPAVLVTASDVTFIEGKAPHVMSMGRVSAIDAPAVTRENIDDFVRATAPADGIAKLAALVSKTADDYAQGQRWDTIDYRINTPEYSYRVNYKLSMSGAGLTIRRITKPANKLVSAMESSIAESVSV